jgi:hypothetical protein
MMILLGITVAVIIFLITMLIILRKRKKCSLCLPKETPTSKTKAPEPIKPQQEAKYAKAAVSPQIMAVENTSIALPQDSILKRHYFTHLCAMLEALVPPRPTDSVLCRHYDSMIVTKIAQCLNDKKTTEQLIYEYEQLSA